MGYTRWTYYIVGYILKVDFGTIPTITAAIYRLLHQVYKLVGILQATS